MRWRALAIGALGTLALAASAADAPSYVVSLGDAVNAYRAASELPPLVADAKLDAIARGHSAAMAKGGKMGHEGFPDRVKRSGWPMCVENVGWNFPTARAQFDAWRQSPGHDRNLRHPRVERMGIGVADGYVTFIACGP